MDRRFLTKQIKTLLKKTPLLGTIYTTRKELYKLREQVHLLYNALYSYSAMQSEEYSLNKENRPDNIIVSLTTHSTRIKYVHLSIESIMKQTVKPDKIILWLTEGEFKREDISHFLKQQEKRGLLIETCRDLKQYQKLVPCLERYPESLIITIDDDVIYPLNLIENLYESYKKDNTTIHCNRAHLIKYSKSGEMLPYQQWEFETENAEKSLDIFPTGIGGVLYYPGCFDERVAEQDLFMKYSPNNDDIWFKAMSYIKKVPCKIIQKNHITDKYIDIFDTQDIALWKVNQKINDKQLKDVFQFLGL